jgi:uncharacterized damage-inducible protein DinB
MEQITPILDLFKINTHLLLKSIEGITDEQALIRPNSSTNNVAFLVIHLLGSKEYQAKIIGLKIEIPGSGKFKDIKKVEDISEYPKIKDLEKIWRDTSDKILSALQNLKAETLMGPSPYPLPIVDPSLMGALTSFMQHDSYHIGQIAFLRKYLGLSPMSYK